MIVVRVREGWWTRRRSVAWMARHPVVCALILAVAIGLAPAIGLVGNQSLPEVLLTVLALVGGGGVGFLFSLMARRTAEDDGR